MGEIFVSEWWEPSRPDDLFRGTLFEESNSGWVLQLDLSLEQLLGEVPISGKPYAPFNNIREYPVLCGKPDGKYLTLFDCRLMSTNWSLAGRPQVKVKPSFIAYDVHFKDFRLISLSVRYSNLDAWVATSGFKIELGLSSEYWARIQYRRPSAINMGTANGLNLSVEFAVTGPKRTPQLQVQAQMEQMAWVCIKAQESRPFDEFLGASDVLSDFITLGVGQHIRRFGEMWAVCVTEKEGRETPFHFKLLQNGVQIVTPISDIDVTEMLFTLPDVLDKLPKVLNLWFGKDDGLQVLYEIYFGTVRSPSMYLEHRFLNMFQALESYDRRMYIPDSEVVVKHEERKDRIFEAVDDNDRKWLKGKLKHSLEPQASIRIRRLVDKVDAKWLLTQEEIEQAAVFRNFLTHFSIDLENRLPPKVEHSLILHNLAVRLQILCELTLLDGVGLSSNDMRKRIEETRRLEKRLAH